MMQTKRFSTLVLVLTLVLLSSLLILVLNLALPSGGALAGPARPDSATGRRFLPLLMNTSPLGIPFGQRKAVLDAIQARFDAQKGQDIAARRQALADYARSLPLIAAAGVADDGSVWGRFTDGRLLIIAPTPVLPPHAMQTVDPESAVTALPQPELPGTDTAYVLNAMGTCFQDPSASVAGWFANQKYTIASISPSVPELRTVHDAAVFYIDTHGGDGLDLTSRPVYAMWTTTPFSLQWETGLAGDLVAGRLVYMLADNNRAVAPAQGCVAEWHYGITPSFVSAYMHFAPNSFVYFDGCSSGSYAADAFRRAFQRAGASMYAGWTIPVIDSDAALTTQYLFDRVLGANSHRPRTPPQRPFDLMSVASEMKNLGIDRSVYCRNYSASCLPSQQVTSTLRYFPLIPDSTSEFGLLAPTIDRAETLDPPWPGSPDLVRLDLFGEFGSERGQVLVGGAPLHILSWMTDTIQTELPPHGAGSAGDIVVSVRDHTSNAVPLTEWRGRVRWRQDYAPMYGPGPYAEVTCDLHFRSDFHRSRAFSGQEPAWPDFARSVESQDSHCSWTMGGQATFTEQSTGYVLRFVLSGSGELVWSPPSSGPGPYLGFSGLIYPEQKQLLMGVSGEAHGQWTAYEDDRFQYTTTQILAGTGPVFASLDAEFNILPGISTFDSSDDGPVTTSWGPIPARYAPTDATAG